MIIDNKDIIKVIKIEIKDTFLNLFITKITKHHINTDPSNKNKKKVEKTKPLKS